MGDCQITLEIERSRLVRYLVIRGLIPITILVFILLVWVWAAYIDPHSNPAHPVIIAMFAIVGATAVGATVWPSVYVRALKYWIDGTTLRIDQGIVVRQCKSIPLDRVTDIEMIQGPVMRMCGIWALRIQTAGSTGREPEGVISGAVDAESVRDMIVTIRDKAATRTNAAT